MKTLQHGDYVTDLTRKQFDELLKIGHGTLSWSASIPESYKFIPRSLTISEEGRLNHTEISRAINNIPFKEFKQRAINTFKFD